MAALGAGNGQNVPWMKQSISSTAGRQYSLFKSTGYPTAGATPSTGAGDANSSSTTGAFPLTNPSGANKLYGLTHGAGGATAGVIMIYDRLVATSGLSGTAAGAQTINSIALTRYTSGVGVLCAIEVYTALGATPRTATLSYTNQSAVAGQVSGTVSIGANVEAQHFLGPFPLAAGDTGIQSVQSLTLSGSTGSAGNFGITLYVPIAFVSYGVPPYYNEKDMIQQLAQLPIIQASACLALIAQATASTLGDQRGQWVMAQG